MKKLLTFFALILVLGTFAFNNANAVPVTVTNPTNTTPNLAATYTSLANAITALDGITAISGPVTITAASGSETAPAGGFVINFTAVTTATNNVVITGTATTTITAFTPQTSSNLNDAIFKIIGSDFVTIQNFTMLENAANTTTAVGTNNMTEWGIALLYASAINGAQNNTIQNNTISLNRSYSNTFGIYSNVRHTATSISATADITNVTGSNLGNKVYTNAISNVDYGIVFVGSNSASTMDVGNDIGGSSLSTANTITNWGGLVSGAISSYTSVTGSNTCIYMNHQVGENVSFNTVTSATNITTLTTSGFLGILKAYTVSQPTGLTFTSNYNNNTVTLTNAPTTSQMTGMGLQGLTTLSTATFNCNNNNIINCAVTGASATSASMIGMLHSSAPGTFNINGNTIRGFTTTATTGGFLGIQQQTNGVVTALNLNNNTIGDATAGAVTFSGATPSGTVIGLSVTSTGAASTCALSITGNDIRGITYTGAGSGAHSYIINVATTLSQNISSNTFTNLNVNTTGSATFLSNSVSLTATGTMRINKNSIVTAFNKGGSGGSITLFTNGASSVAGSIVNNDSNNFSNITITGTTSIIGWNQNDGGAPTKTVQLNTFRNWTAGSGTITGLLCSFSGASRVANNSIGNITGSGAITGITTGSGIDSIFSNTVDSLYSTGGVAVIGISCTGGTTKVINKNKIYDLQANNASGTVNGILVSAGTTVSVFNNITGDLKTPSANALNPLIGINVTGGTTVNIYYNTVRLSGTSTGALFGSSAFFGSTSPTTLTVRNNIFVNVTVPVGATGFSVAHRRSATALTNYGAASNNNLYFTSSTPDATHLIFYDGTNSDQTLAAFKTRVSPRDVASVTENPTFVSTVGSDPNFLHVNTSIATQIESGATNIGGITDDFDSQTRQGNAGYSGSGTAPDIGADEFNGVPSDLIPPAITYTALLGTCSTGDRPLTGVTITDASGVPITGSLVPRIYYKKNAGSYFSQPGTFASGSATNGQWNFNIVAADMSGLTAGDVVSYYVIAQDVAAVPNIGANPGAGLVATNVNAVTTHPTSPNTFGILATLSGTYTVGSGGNYATLTLAVADYNTKCVSGNVVFSLTDATYPSESFPITINANSGASSVNTLTIKPTGNTTISGTSATGLIVFNGADYVTIDGSSSSTVNTVCPPSAATRNLTITNTNTSTTSAVVWLQSNGADGATNNNIINCNISGNAPLTTLAGIGMGGSTISATSLGNGNHHNSIINNNVSKVQYAVYSQGASTAAKNRGNTINQNLINTASPNQVSKSGILLGFEDTAMVSGNNISNISTAAQYAWAISLGMTTINTTTFAGNDVTNSSVTKNLIGSVRCGNTWGAAGITVASATTGQNIISDNMISDVATNGTTGDNGFGIMIGGGSGSTTQVYYNSVTMVATLTGGSGPNIALGIGGTNPTVDVRNNILISTGSTGTGKNHAIALNYASPYTNLTSNNNDLFVSGTGAAVGVTNGFTGTVRTTLGDWQTETGKDAASKNVLPVFLSATDLHLLNTNASNNTNLNGMGALVSKTDDIDCDVRDLSTPDIGADEYTPLIVTVHDVGVSSITTGFGANAIIPVGSAVNLTSRVTNFGTVSETVVPVYYTVNGGSPVGPVNTVGPIAVSGFEDVVFSGPNAFTPASPGTYTIVSYTQLGTDLIPGNDATTIVITAGTPVTSYPYTNTGGTLNGWSVLTQNAVGHILWQRFIGPKNPNGTAADTAWGSDCFSSPSTNGAAEILRSPLLNLSSLTKPVIHFYTAYRSFSSENDSMQVLISTNNGSTFINVPVAYRRSNSSIPSLATLPPSSTAFVPAAASEWRHETIDLTAYAGQTVVIGYRSVSNFGNLMWMDNFIATNADANCTSTVIAPGSFACNSSLTVNMTTVGLIAPLNLNDSRSDNTIVYGNTPNTITRDLSKMNALVLDPSQVKKDGATVVNNTKNTRDNTDNLSGGELSVTEHDNQSPVPSNLVSPIATNAGATTQSGLVYTPAVIGTSKWYTVAYTGNDKAGYANYSISIDVSAYPSYLDRNKAYIVKRSDLTGQWECINTTASGNILTASGLNLFSDFAVSFIPNDLAVIANVAPTGTLNDCPAMTIAPKATIQNVGMQNYSSPFNITYTVTGPVNYTNTKSDTLASGISRTITFDSTFIPNIAGTYNVVIYTSPVSDNNRSNDTLVTSFTVITNPNDVGATANVEPTGILYDCPAMTIAPKATIQNFGAANQYTPFSIIYQVTGPVSYADTLSDTLSAGGSRTVTFDSSFIPNVTGTYNVKVFTTLGSDCQNSNDTTFASFSVTASPNNLGVTANIEPSGLYADCPATTIAPKATIQNFGSADQLTPFTIVYKVTGPVSYADSLTDTLSAGISRTETFDSSLVPNVPGTYTVKVYTSLNTDCTNGNDTLYATFTVVNPNYGGGASAQCNYFFANSTACSNLAPNKPIFYWEDTTGSVSLIENGTDVSGGLITGSLDNGYFSLGNILTTGDKFRFSSVDYDSFYVAINGMIGMTTSGNNSTLLQSNSPATIPSLSAAYPCIFPLWMDLNYGDADVSVNRLSYKVDGTNNKLIITYDRAPRANGAADPDDYVSFQVVLETSPGPTQNGLILVQYDNSRSGSSFLANYSNGTLATHVLGISNGTCGIEYRHLPNSIGPLFGPLAVAYGPDINALPVELTSFTSSITQRNVLLNWITANETNNAGFDIERKPASGSSWTKVGNIAGSGNSSTSKNYAYTDRSLSSGKYNYRLKQMDFNGNHTYYNLSNEVNIGVPDKYELSQNYPNPFNPTTKINYDLPFNSRVSIKLFDISGREVASLVNETMTAGYYTVNFNGSNLSSGVYFYRILAEGNGQNFVSTKKMMLVK